MVKSAPGVKLVIPAKSSAADARLRAWAVVPIYIVELLAALSPVLLPETETAPAPIVKTELLAELAVKVSVPVFTVRAVVKVALVTAPAVKLAAVPDKLVAVPEEGVPNAPPE